jgi:hypothetical protein
MSEPERRRTGEGMRRLATAAVVIHATLGLTLFMIPQSLINWINDHDSAVSRAVLLAVANAIERTSNMIGTNYPYLYLRQRYPSATGKDDVD